MDTKEAKTRSGRRLKNRNVVLYHGDGPGSEMKMRDGGIYIVAAEGNFVRAGAKPKSKKERLRDRRLRQLAEGLR